MRLKKKKRGVEGGGPLEEQHVKHSTVLEEGARAQPRPSVRK